MPRTPAPTPPEFRFAGPAPFANDREAQEIVELLGIVLRDAPVGIARPMPDAILLETLGGGRSGAHVFKATACTVGIGASKDDRKVVKITRLEAGISEKANYDRFVRPFLPEKYRPKLLRFATAHGRAALCYSHLGDGENSETLTDRLAAGDLAALDLIVPSLFEDLRQCWWGADQPTGDATLSRYYLNRYFGNLDAAAEAEAVLFRHAAQFLGAKPCAEGYRIEEAFFPSICGTLFADPGARTYASAIVHGDLNSDNVILDRRRATAHLVDFQRTGPGHVLQDLATIEASLRINYPPGTTVSNMLEVERLIAHGDSRLRSDPYSRAIVSIRETARRLFERREGAANYPLAVAAIGLRLMKATDLSEAALARISAGALWAAKMCLED